MREVYNASKKVPTQAEAFPNDTPAEDSASVC